VRAFIGLGSNQGNSRRILGNAVRTLRDECGGVVDCSYLYRSKAELVEDQNDFYNAVVEIETEKSPEDLLVAMQGIQKRFKKSPVRYGPRELDLDIIAYGQDQVTLSEPVLTIPHERAHERDFVLRPLCDLQSGHQVLLDGGRRAIDVFREEKRRNIATRVCNPIWSKREDLEDHQTLVMGVLNVTPDSFSDGGKYTDVNVAISHALEMVDHGVDIIDIGGESTRPFADIISVQEEMGRVLPVLEKLKSMEEFAHVAFSIDTRKALVAEEAVRVGVDLINDQVGEVDDEEQSMLKIASKTGVPIITMHSRGTSQTMESLVQEDTNGFDIVDYVSKWLDKRVLAGIRNYGIPRWSIMVDPGLGFAKTNSQSATLLARSDELVYRHPVLIGASRKRFVREHCLHDIDISTSATTTMAALNGATVVRVHDVAKNIDAARMGDALRAVKVKS